MSERLEQWKAREKIRSQIGWVAVLIGVWALLAIAGALAEIVGGASGGTPAPFLLAAGIAFLFCAAGLWSARAWARWVAAALFAGQSAQGGITLVADHELRLGLPFVLFATAFLLLPSTGRRFARAQGARARAGDPG